MPWPWIIGAGLAILAGAGVKKHLDASENNDMAESIMSDARSAYNGTKNQVADVQKKVQKKLSSLGKIKYDIQVKQIDRFVDMYGKFKNVSFKGKMFDDSENFTEKAFADEYKKMKVASINMQDIIAAGGGSIGAGAMAGIAAYGGVSMFATASTGTAIAGLSGAAATNATLAWLGGGSLATGGLGIAGGTAVLGGIVVAPIIAVSGFLHAAEAEKNLAKAKATYAKAMDAVQKMRTIISFCNELSKLAGLYEDFFSWFSDVYEKSLDDFQKLCSYTEKMIEDDGRIDFDSLSYEQQKVIHANRLITQLMWTALKMPLLTTDNRVNKKAKTALDEYNKQAELLVTTGE